MAQGHMATGARLVSLLGVRNDVEVMDEAERMAMYSRSSERKKKRLTRAICRNEGRRAYYIREKYSATMTDWRYSRELRIARDRFSANCCRARISLIMMNYSRRARMRRVYIYTNTYMCHAWLFLRDACSRRTDQFALYLPRHQDLATVSHSFVVCIKHRQVS